MCFNCETGITDKFSTYNSMAELKIDTYKCRECGYMSEDIYDFEGTYLDTRYFDSEGFEIEEEGEEE